MLATVFAPALQLAADLHARRELAFWNRLQQRLVAHAKCIGRLQVERDLKAGLLAFKCFLNLQQRVAVAAVQIHARVGAFFNHLTAYFSNFKTQCDGGVFFDFHGRFQWLFHGNNSITGACSCRRSGLTAMKSGQCRFACKARATR